MASVDTYSEAEAYLFGRVNFERAHAAGATAGDFKLDRMRELLRKLGDPHLAIPCIHIAGTKGKGSTAAMAASILQVAGRRVGLYTSPHIARFEERMTVNGALPTGEQVVSLVRRVRAVADAIDSETGRSACTFFEILTAMAWLHYLDEKVEIVVLEVGLGGRLDSTNLCRPEVCVITSISRDHTNLLGPTLGHIAREKAGIIKPDVPVISGAETAESQEPIREIALRNSAPLFELSREVRFDAHVKDSGSLWVDVETPWRRHRRVQVALIGSHQARNAALAVAAIDALRYRGWSIADSAIAQGMQSVRWPLRIEVIRRCPTVILDAAHNWASIKALLETLDAHFPAERRILLFAGTKDKDVSGLLRQLLPRFDTIILTQYRNNPRAVTAAQLATMVRQLCDRPFHIAGGPDDAWRIANRLADIDDLICITGSFFLAAELRERLRW